MELQIDIECSCRKDVIEIATLWNFKLTWTVHKGNMISKIPTTMELQIDIDCPQG